MLSAERVHTSGLGDSGRAKRPVFPACGEGAQGDSRAAYCFHGGSLTGLLTDGARTAAEVVDHDRWP